MKLLRIGIDRTFKLFRAVFVLNQEDKKVELKQIFVKWMALGAAENMWNIRKLGAHVLGRDGAGFALSDQYVGNTTIACGIVAPFGGEDQRTNLRKTRQKSTRQVRTLRQRRKRARRCRSATFACEAATGPRRAPRAAGRGSRNKNMDLPYKWLKRRAQPEDFIARGRRPDPASRAEDVCLGLREQAQGIAASRFGRAPFPRIDLAQPVSGRGARSRRADSRDGRQRNSILTIS
jgi:hypothetical protein